MASAKMPAPPSMTVEAFEASQFRGQANGNVCRVGCRDRIGWVEWVLVDETTDVFLPPGKTPDDYPAGGWQGFRANDACRDGWNARSRVFQTRAEAERWVAERALSHLRLAWHG